ncbi:hypothetical protein RchiOBHm_Chr5g0035691 [Rosa chinensis]|uniref:Uncharacterized protein n=1 Tax=Rosa chinensis TaxID=74649 RepID=A0A2P6QBB5_ROSCH|nr:hypothetical protein RchiOBHm_Chr5g0035691 [Rosa chinensis]
MVPIGALEGHSTQNVCQDFAPLAKNDGSSSFQMKTFVNAIADMAKAVTTRNIQEGAVSVYDIAGGAGDWFRGEFQRSRP